MYNVAAAILLVPLVTSAFWLVFSFSGQAALTDTDIALFAVRPVGLLSLIFVGALLVVVVALEHAALMAIGFAAGNARRIDWHTALGFALRRTWPIVQTAGRVIARSLLLAAPFLAAGGGVFWIFLTEHDINFYLHEKPPVFWTAGVLIAGFVAALAAVLIRAFVCWAFALPLLLFGSVSAKNALRASAEATSGRRWRITVALIGWLVASTAVTAAATWIVREIGVSVLAGVTGSLGLMVLVVGTILLLGGLVNFPVAFLNTSTLSLLVVRLFRDAGLGNDSDVPAVAGPEPAIRLPTWMFSRRTLLWGGLRSCGGDCLGRVRHARGSTAGRHDRSHRSSRRLGRRSGEHVGRHRAGDCRRRRLGRDRRARDG